MFRSALIVARLAETDFEKALEDVEALPENPSSNIIRLHVYAAGQKREKA